MPPRIKSEKNEIKIAGELRRSQMITTFGCGSLVDLPRFSGIMAGLDSWNINALSEDDNKIHEPNLQKMLDVDCFYQVETDTDKKNVFTLPAYRFPTWYYCPNCHRLDSYKKIYSAPTKSTSKYNHEFNCKFCSDKKHKVKLIPSRFVMACENGHIDDFPYVWWVHRGEPKCSNPQLKIEYKGTTGGLDSIVITCLTCGASTTMAGCMSNDALKGLKCDGKMPWLGLNEDKKPWYRDKEPCNAIPRTLQRSANNVYYPVNKSALTIPPWSNKLQNIFERENSKYEFFFSMEPEKTDELLKLDYDQNPELYNNDFESYKKAAYMRFGELEEEVTEQTIRYDEYKALSGEDIDDELFRTESVDVPEMLQPYIKQIKLVKKIREVMALQGFRRILPVKEMDEQKAKEKGLYDREFSPLSKEKLRWLPAIQLFGEGIFIELDLSAVEKWELNNHDRYIAMETKLDMPWIGNDMFNAEKPRYVLLHTLSHLLIRQLTAQCGYATASIKEKIYSTYNGENHEMCGFMIYTSATDTDGSLGGLVRQGHTHRIKETFENLLEEGSWCSNDPLCIESKSQGFKGLNYAACHACTLLPETSCEAMNCLLDRAAVVGTLEDKEVGYFGKLL